MIKVSPQIDCELQIFVKLQYKLGPHQERESENFSLYALTVKENGLHPNSEQIKIAVMKT